MKLAKRTYLHGARLRRRHPALKAFLAPQREHPPKVQHPKPERVAA